uniref:Uncharacterized protein n=1 Tax=Pseudodiaptomus poplesia TaxID=213370 RepID=A0A1S6GL89_9MAXI|nr:hypothetical protein [Pseudodiaptomus poplesia]
MLKRPKGPTSVLKQPPISRRANNLNSQPVPLNNQSSPPKLMIKYL